MVNLGPLAAEIVSLVWDTPAYFNGFCALAALLHGTQVLGVSQSLRRWTEGATYIRQGGHHVGHWPTFLVLCIICSLSVKWWYLKTNRSSEWIVHSRCYYHSTRVRILDFINTNLQLLPLTLSVTRWFKKSGQWQLWGKQGATVPLTETLPYVDQFFKFF